MVKIMSATKIKKSQYEALKESYLLKNKSIYTLYLELNKEMEVSKHLFFKLINKIRQEEGLSHYYN